MELRVYQSLHVEATGEWTGCDGLQLKIDQARTSSPSVTCFEIFYKTPCLSRRPWFSCETTIPFYWTNLDISIGARPWTDHTKPFWLSVAKENLPTWFNKTQNKEIRRATTSKSCFTICYQLIPTDNFGFSNWAGCVNASARKWNRNEIKKKERGRKWQHALIARKVVVF